MWALAMQKASESYLSFHYLFRAIEVRALACPTPDRNMECLQAWLFTLIILPVRIGRVVSPQLFWTVLRIFQRIGTDFRLFTFDDMVERVNCMDVVEKEWSGFSVESRARFRNMFNDLDVVKNWQISSAHEYERVFEAIPGCQQDPSIVQAS